MKLQQVLLLKTFIIFLIQGAAKTIDSNPICTYARSVEVTKVANGIYMFGNIEIPAKFVQTFNYTLADNDTRISVPEHERGCICRVKSCINICTQNLKRFFLQYVMTRMYSDDILIKQVELSNGTEIKKHLIHDFIHVVGEICDEMIPLTPELKPNMGYTLYEDGTLLRNYDGFEFNPDEYCFDVNLFKKDEDILFLASPYICYGKTSHWKRNLTAYSLIFSIPFLIITIIIYGCCSFVRQVHEKCFISFLTAMAVAYTCQSLTLLYKDTLKHISCSVLGYSSYYFQNAFLMWTCIISYNYCKTLTNIAVKKSFLIYSLVAWSVPLLLTLLSYLVSISNISHNLKPNIGGEDCNFAVTQLPIFIYVHMPYLVILILCIVFYSRVLCYIASNKRSVRSYEANDSASKNQGFWLYFSLFVFMGPCWLYVIVLNIVGYIEHTTTNYKVKAVIFSIPNFINALQGPVIFIIFVLRKQFCKKIRTKYCGRKNAGART